MDHLIGQTLNRYRITRLLGEGGMGAVYQAYDLTLERYVAVKVLYPQYARLPNFQERFLQEARSAARLDHPGIVQVHDFGQDHSFLFIVMEYIPGENLEKILRTSREQGKWIVLPEAIRLIQQLCQAIAYAHRQGVLHRDIKPSNVMLESETTGELPYRPVITDLGLAKLAEGGILTQEGGFLGTPAYLSPEQASGQTTDERSDVYSLGVLLYELCTGQKPFPAKSISEAVRYHVHTPVPLPRTIFPELPESLQKVILRALEKDRDRRYDSASQLAEALQEILPETSTMASLPAPFQTGISLYTLFKNGLDSGNKHSLGKVSGSAGGLSPERDLDARRLEAGIMQSSTGRQKVAVFVENLQLSVEPGRSVPVQVILLNQSSETDRIRVVVDGIPSSWLNIPAQAIPMLPGIQQNLTFHIQPPRLPESRAGRYPFTIRITCQASPEEIVEVKGILTVSAYSLFSSELVPRHLRAGEIGQLHLRNQGNYQETYRIFWEDRENKLAFTPSELSLKVLEGQAAIAEYRVEPIRNSWLGEENIHTFTTRITPSSGPSSILEGEISSHSSFPLWIIPAVLIGCVLLAGIFLVFSGVIASGSNQATQDAWAIQTDLVIAVQGTNQAATATSLSLSNANQATINAVTATARWMVGDDDGDGLSNSTELDLKTLADNADTDQDGLSDGEEVNGTHTNPLKIDSDEDGLKDGDEVKAGLDPLKSDSDGDGIIDSLDKDPLSTSSPTPNTAATIAAAFTQTAQAFIATQTAEALGASATSQSATLTASASIPQTWSHPFSLLGNRTTYNLRLVSPGQIRVHLNWMGGQDNLSLTINGPGQADPYAQEDGSSGLEVAYTVNPGDFASGDLWRVTIASSGTAEAEGTVEIFYPSGASSSLVITDFSINPSFGSSVSLIVLDRNGAIDAQADWNGVPADLSFLISGPGLDGTYARQDGASPLRVSYTVSLGDFSSGNLWMVSLLSLNNPDLNGNLVIIYP